MLIVHRINARLGGVNSTIDSPVNPILENAMVVGGLVFLSVVRWFSSIDPRAGADVGHPGPGVTHQPSVTGLVASADRHIGRFSSFSCVQQPRLEIIQDLETMMEARLVESLFCCEY